MDVHQGLPRLGDVDQAVAAARGFAEARADQQQQVGLFDPVAQRRRHRDADVTGVVGMGVVEIVLAPEGHADRQVEVLGEGLDVGARLGAPTAAAQDHERTLRVGEQSAQARHVRGRRVRLRDVVARGIGAVGRLGQHVLRQRDHHGARPARDRGVERAADHLRNARRVVDLAHPFGQRAEHRAIIDLLERLAPAHAARDLADQKDHRGRVPGARCARRARRWSRRGRG